MKKFLLFLSLLCLASVALAQRSLNVVYIGNSITYGAMHKDPVQTAPPVICSQWLAKQQGIDHCWYVNMGKSGKTTFNFVPAKTDIKNYWSELVEKTAELVSQHPEAQLVFSIMLGTNDTAERPSNSRTTPFMYRHNMELIIDSLQARYPDATFVLHKPIFFSVPFTTRNGSIQSSDSHKMLDCYFAELKKIANDHAAQRKAAGKSGLRVFVGDDKAFGYFKRTYHETLVHEHGYQECDFWLHPNESGSATLAEYWGQAILKAL